jgi:hypothetical protein
MDDLPEALELLSSRVDALEKRIHALEHPSELFALSAVREPAAPTAAQVAEETSIEQASGVFPVLGKAMLGIAGAYVLRAIMESSSLPKQAIAAVAIAYALAWLVWAARAAATARFAGVIYAGASALILAPMLWELTLRFHVLPPALTAGVLGLFVLTATALAWKSDLAPVFWMADGAAALTALALLIGTHVMVPFIAALLLMVVICEYAMARNRGEAIRPLVAAVTDAAVWLLLFTYSGPQADRADYPQLGTLALLAPACLLFLIDGASVAVKTMVLQRKITAFETIQAIIAFLLAAVSVLSFQPRSGPIVLGVFCLVLSAACYTAAFAFFDHAPERNNFSLFATWSVALFLAGSLWCAPPGWAAAVLGLAALVAIVLGVRLGHITLEFHGLIYLVAAALACGLLQYAFSALAGPMPSRPAWSIFLVSACAVLCYAVGKERVGEAWTQQVLHLVPAFLAVFAMAALLTQGLLGLAALRITPDVFHVAFIRTLTICSVALGMAFGGSRWQRLEMTRIAYAALAFVAAKLFFEDLRHGRMEFIAASIFLVALTLIAVPRLTRMGHRA